MTLTNEDMGKLTQEEQAAFLTASVMTANDEVLPLGTAANLVLAVERLLSAPAPAGSAAAERDRIVRVIRAEGKRLADAALSRMMIGEEGGEDMAAQYLRGSAISNLALVLPDLLAADARRSGDPA